MVTINAGQMRSGKVQGILSNELFVRSSSGMARAITSPSPGGKQSK